MNKLVIVSSIFICALSGCKTIDSVQQDLGSLASSITGEEATPEQIHLIVQEALSAYNQIDADN